MYLLFAGKIGKIGKEWGKMERTREGSEESEARSTWGNRRLTLGRLGSLGGKIGNLVNPFTPLLVLLIAIWYMFWNRHTGNIPHIRDGKTGLGRGLL